MSQETMPDPLPESWLPEPARESGDEAAWEERVSRIVAAAEPRLQRLGRRDRPAGSVGDAPARGWLEVGRWWRPAAALAAAAVLALFVTSPEAPEAAAPPGSPALGLVVSEGAPGSLWDAAGGRAHPVLALIALEEETP